jgi:hypothetical protein
VDVYVHTAATDGAVTAHSASARRADIGISKGRVGAGAGFAEGWRKDGGGDMGGGGRGGVMG